MIDSLGNAVSFSGAGAALIVMAIVFAVLAVLFFVLLLFGLIFRKRKASETHSVLPPLAVDDALEDPPEPPREDTKLVAVLTAAVLAARQTQETPTGFRVVSFRRHS